MVVDELIRPLGAYARRHAASTASSAPATVAAAAASSAASQKAAVASPAAGEDWRFDLVRSVGEECQTEQELRSLLQRKPDTFQLYDGFEPSGRMHIAQGVFKAINVNKCTQAGGTFIFWVADWFALMNDKMGGDLEKIKTVGKYLIEVWKASGMDMSRVKFLWCSDEIVNKAREYWRQALDIARLTTVTRVKRCCQIMGRKEDSLTAAQIVYPIMQCTDIFFLKADICQLGVDQRKVNMLAREYCDAAGLKTKPVVLSHHMLYGLKAGQAKMSKSDPDSAIFMEDTAADVERKIMNAYCPMKPEADGKAPEPDNEMQLVKDDLKNPCLDYVKNILFCKPGYTFSAGGKNYTEYEAVKQSFVSGELSEKLLKERIIEEVNKLLDPVRQHFASDANAKELLAKITQWKKENLPPPDTVTRLKIIEAGAAPTFVVFAPLPTETVQLDAVLGVADRLKQAPKGHQAVLWLDDWSALTLGHFNGSPSCIQAFYDIFLFGLRSIVPDLMKNVRICWQGEMILNGPSEYWISVINVGRRYTLEVVKNSFPEGSSLDYASQVISALMHVGDVLSLAGGESTVLCGDTYRKNFHNLASQHCKICGLAQPKVMIMETPKLRLLEDGDGVEIDTNIMLLDKEIDVNKKVKKAFCQPENVDFNPPIAWVGEFLKLEKDFVVTRKPDNGGDKTYTDVEHLRKDFQSGEMHPGDLKPSLGKKINAFLETVRGALKDSDVAKKAQKELDNFAAAQKKAQKKK